MHRMEGGEEPRSSDRLWAEAFWGLGLIGVVLGFVLVLVTLFGW